MTDKVSTQEEVIAMSAQVDRGIGHFELVKLFSKALGILASLAARVEKLESQKKEGTS